MRVVVQRVSEASVSNNNIHNAIQKGYCLLVGVGKNSTEADVQAVAKKIANARLFEDENDKLNYNIQQIEGEILSISQFTLYADVKKVIALVFLIQCHLRQQMNYMNRLTKHFDHMV